MPVPRWLLLAHQLPTRPSNARVKTWRRLQQIGAVPVRNSVYVLPNNEQCREDFEWLRAEIAALGGEATVFAADALDHGGGDEIAAAFQRARQAEYRELKREAERLTASAERQRPTTATGRDRVGRAVRNLREHLSEVERIDFFGAPGRQEVATSIRALDRVIADGRPKGDVKPGPAPALSVTDYQHRRWVTRPRPGVDRMASAWLIRRYIDPRATFAFVDKPAKTDVAFDMYVGQFGHDGPLCTFEVLAQRFGLVGLAITRIGHIVHDLDLKETRYASPEAPTVGRMVEGLRRVHATDDRLLRQGAAMFETLSRSFDLPDGEAPASPARKKRGSSRRRRTRTRS